MTEEKLNKFINKMMITATIDTTKKIIRKITKDKETVWNKKKNTELVLNLPSKLDLVQIPGAKFGTAKNVPIFEKTDWKIYDGRIRTESNKQFEKKMFNEKFNNKVILNKKEWVENIENKKFNTDNWKKQKRDSKGRFIPKKGK